MDENKFHSVENVEDFAGELGVAVQDTFKYLVTCVVNGVNPEDAQKLTPELLEAFKSLKSDCEEFIKTFNFYSVQLELFQKAEAEGRVEEIRENFPNFLMEIMKEIKSRNL